MVMDNPGEDVEGRRKTVWRKGKGAVFIERVNGIKGGSEGGRFAGDGDPALKEKVAAGAFDGDDPDGAIHKVLFPVCPGDEGYLMVGCGVMHETLESAVQGMMGVVGPMV
jgi:hypothetical protein